MGVHGRVDGHARMLHLHLRARRRDSAGRPVRRAVARLLLAVRTRRHRMGTLPSLHSRDDLAGPEIVARTDSEGDPYFICLLALPDGEPLAVAEAHMRPAVETVRQRLLSALGAA